MEMKVIDTVEASTLAKGDWIGLYDHDLQAYQAFEIVSVEDMGDGIEIVCDWYDEPVVYDYDKRVDIYGY
jgi:hypothetical protein